MGSPHYATLQHSTSVTNSNSPLVSTMSGLNRHTLSKIRCMLSLAHAHTLTQHTRLSSQDWNVLFLPFLSRAHNMPGAFPLCSRIWKASLHVLLSFSAPTFWRHDVTSLAGDHDARSIGVILEYWPLKLTPFDGSSGWHTDYLTTHRHYLTTHRHYLTTHNTHMNHPRQGEIWNHYPSN